MSRAVIAQLDEVLERQCRLREELLVHNGAAFRAERLAALYESEARVWSQVFELATQRLVWRAALAAEARARIEARRWWTRAVDEAAPEVLVPGMPADLPPVLAAVEV
jgi:hypothetical protein